MNIFTGYCWKDKNEEKEAGNGLFKKTDERDDEFNTIF